jgi:hypothetical protein
LEPAGDAQSACQLDAVRESRFAAEVASSPGAAAAITRILRGQCAQLTGRHGGACRALLSGVDECASVTDAFERDLCQGYVIEADCETPTPAEFTIQACLFGRAMATGSLVACALLEDADARHLCEARVNGSAVSCRRLSRPDLVKRCRQALRDGTTPSLTWLKGGDAAASPSPGASVGQKPAVASEPPTAEGDPCADAEPNDPICSLQDP